MSKSKGPGTMTVREAGRKGAETVLARYGPEHFRRIGRKGGMAYVVKYIAPGLLAGRDRKGD